MNLNFKFETCIACASLLVKKRTELFCLAKQPKAERLFDSSGTGMDAQVSYAFHSQRKLHPEKFKNQLSNQVN